MATVEDRVEKERGCGYRKPGGLYLVGGKLSAPCGKLPIELDVCPCCNGGIKQSRGFTWVSSQLVEKAACSKSGCKTGCSAFSNQSEYGLLWIGEGYYPNVSDYTREAAAQGISKRIKFIPKKLVVGQTWVLLAHPRAITCFTDDPENPVEYKKGIFSAFIPERIEYVVKGTESEDELNDLEKRGLTLVRVIKEESVQMSI